MGPDSSAVAGEPDVREPLRLLLRDLHTGPSGLTSREAARRLAVHGRNEMVEAAGPSMWREVAGQLVHPLALLLWLAAVLSLVIGTPLLAAAIAAVVLLNALFALWQERQTEQAVALLRSYLPPMARALRDGSPVDVPVAELVPGDVVLLGEGDRVSADGRLIDGALEIDMSTLTGESVPVERVAGAEDAGVDRLSATDLVFSGTAVVGGSGRAVVSATGMGTEIGRIAALSQRTGREASPLERQVRRVAWLIAGVAVAAGIAFIPIGTLAAGLPVQAAVVFAIGLLVANVPEGLLPTITLALAVGVRDLAARGALVKRLSAVETLGSTDVICTDKTGTLTMNRMAPVVLWTPAGEYEPPETASVDAAAAAAAVSIVRCLRWHDRPADPTDAALEECARLVGVAAEPDGDLIARNGFDPARRVMSVVERAPDGGALVHLLGAPEAVLDRCAPGPLGGGIRERVDSAIDSLAGRGLRVVAVARGERRLPGALPSGRDAWERDLTLLALVAMVDPLRPSVPDAVARCHTAGIRVLIVTGDHARTAAAIAEQAGIGGGAPVVSGSLAAMGDAELDALLAGSREVVFARSTPETKLRITDSLRERGSVVAMTGDGVNDAPALRRADIGVAMGRSGTDVAREAATMVLTDDDFGTIVAAVEEGRRVYDNVRKFIVYTFAHATPEMVPLLAFALSGGHIPLPLTVIQILAIDIGTETLPALALGRERPEPGLMDRPPRPQSEPIITRRMLLRAWLLLGGVSAVLVMLGYVWVLVDAGWTWGAPTYEGTALHHAALQASTMVFLGIVACQVGTAMAARTEHSSLRALGWASNPLLLWGIGFEVLFAAVVVAVPGVNDALGMALPPLPHIAVLPLFALAVWAADEAWRALMRHGRAMPE